MMGRLKAGIAALLSLSVAACASSSPTGDSAFLRSLGDQPQPSAIVATELAYAREAREKGARKAYGKYASDGAIVFDQTGPRPGADYIAEQGETAGMLTRDIRRVFMSCNGSHAASMGTFSHIDGTEGVYTTIWARQKNGSYRFALDFPEIGETWKDAGDMVSTTVAECQGTSPGARAQLLAPLRTEMGRDAGAMGVQIYQGVSPDQSFAWSAAHASQDDRGVMLSTFVGGRWVTMAGQREEPSDMVAVPPTPAALPMSAPMR